MLLHSDGDPARLRIVPLWQGTTLAMINRAPLSADRKRAQRGAINVTMSHNLARPFILIQDEDERRIKERRVAKYQYSSGASLVKVDLMPSPTRLTGDRINLHERSFQESIAVFSRPLARGKSSVSNRK